MPLRPFPRPKTKASRATANSRTEEATAAAIEVRVVPLAHAKGLTLPAYQTPGSAGLDLQAAIGRREAIVIAPGARALVPTGLVFELPQGFEAQVRPRSGLALKNGITVLNSPGTIDSDYRGEVKVILINLGSEPFAIARGDRIAQMIITPVTQATLIRAREVTETSRGAGGFGSTRVAAKAKKKNPKTAAASKKKSKR